MRFVGSRELTIFHEVRNDVRIKQDTGLGHGQSLYYD